MDTTWLVKQVLQFYIAGIVDTSLVARSGLTIEAGHRNQLKLALYKPWIYFYSHLKYLYISNKTEHFSCKLGVAYVGMCILRLLKQELAWATDKELWVIRLISNINVI